jgi:hypothetical protein
MKRAGIASWALRFEALASLLLAPLLIVGCAVPALTPDKPPLGVDNGTTLAVTIVVNGSQVDVVPPKTQRFVEPSRLPTTPWRVEARSPTGRVLLSLEVEPGVVWHTSGPNGESSSHGAGVRVDLSCGRLDLYAGPPMLGPMPGPGSPGDCEP